MLVLRCAEGLAAGGATRGRSADGARLSPACHPRRARGGQSSTSLRAPMLGSTQPLLRQAAQRSSSRTQAAATAVRWVAGLRQDAIKVLFNLPYRCDFGQNLAIVGSEHQLGAWDVTKGVALRWSDGDVWQGEIEMDSRAAHTRMEYKYVVRDSDGTAVSWMPGENVCLEMPGLDAHTVVVADAWDGSQTVEIVSRPEVEKETEVIAQQATSTSHAEAPVEETPAIPPETVAAEVHKIADAADEVSAALTDCLINATDEMDIEECLIDAAKPETRRIRESPGGPRNAKLARVLEGIYDPDIASYIVENVADQALAELDDALTMSIEMQDKLDMDPTSPEVLAADRLVAAAARRAVDMTRALEATRSAAMLTSGSSADADLIEELEFPLEIDVEDSL